MLRNLHHLSSSASRRTLLRNTSRSADAHQHAWQRRIDVLRYPLRAMSDSAVSDPTFVSGATGKVLPDIHPIVTWKAAYPRTICLGTAARAQIYNPETARKLVQSYNLDDGGAPKTVIEGYPGPGVHTRALLELPRSVLEKVIILEFAGAFHPEIEAMAAADDRVVLMKESAYYWSIYERMQHEGHLDHIKPHPWSEIHPQLRFVGNLPFTVLGEQLISQLLRAIGDRSWLWVYGRFPMHWLVPDKIYQRLLATEKDINRSKMAVISQTLAEMTEGQPRDTFEPWGDHFHPQSRDGMGISKDYGPVDLKLRHLVSTPRADPAIKEDTLTQWDYVTRKLFVLKSTPLEKAVPNLGAGAKVILPKLSSPDLPPEQRVDITKPVRHLTNADWANVARAFQSWPFRPENLTQPTVQEQEAKDV